MHTLKYIRPALKHFIDNAMLSVHSESGIINFMDYFPLLKSGYALRETIRFLMMAYTIGDPQRYDFVIPDELILESFDEDIPSFYYYDQVEMLVKMQTAVENGVISSNLNTFQVIPNIRPNFNANYFHSSFLKDIIMLNVEEIPKSNVLLRDRNFTSALINEYWLADSINLVLVHISFIRPREKLSIYDILESLNENHTHLRDRLLADNRTNKLIYGIIIDDLKMVEQYINAYDPRDNHFAAYHLAYKKSNMIIIERIREVIIQRILLEQAVFQMMMAPMGESDIPQTEMLYRYSRSLL